MRNLVVLLGLVLATAACSADDPSPTAGRSSRPTQVAPQPHLVALRGEVAALEAALGAASRALDEARTARDLDSAQTAAERAVHALSADRRLAGDLDFDGTVADPGVPPLLPGGSADDLLSRTLAAARAAGAAGVPVGAVLNAPVAGDVTSWQRVPEEESARIRQAAEVGTQEAIRDLPGEVPRAVAWALLAATADGVEEARKFAERGAAHLQIARTALAEVRPQAARGTPVKP